MKKTFDNAMHRLIDRGEWQHSWHMVSECGRILWNDPKNLAVVEREIYAAREQAARLNALADEAEASMRAHMPNTGHHDGAAPAPSVHGFVGHKN